MEELVLTMEEGLFLPDALKAETERKANEETRIANEQERIVNEETRIENEKSRQEKMLELVDTIENKLFFYKKYEYTHITKAVNEKHIYINMPEYNGATILFIKVNGMDLIENIDYTITAISNDIVGGIGGTGAGENSKPYSYLVFLTKPISTIGTKVQFVCLKTSLVSENDYELLRGEKGDNGTDGKDGETPYIGENGNWFIGDVDTGVPSVQTPTVLTQTEYDNLGVYDEDTLYYIREE